MEALTHRPVHSLLTNDIAYYSALRLEILYNKNRMTKDSAPCHICHPDQSEIQSLNSELLHHEQKK